MCNSAYLWNYQLFHRVPFLIRHVQSDHFVI